MIKTLFCTSTADNFAPGCAVMVYSLRKHLKNFEDHTLKIFYSSLSEESKNMIRHAARNIELIFEKPDLKYCKGANTIYGKNNRDVYLCLESFNQPEYDTVVCFDSDMLCISEFDYHMPFKTGSEIAAVYGKQVGHNGIESRTYIERTFASPIINPKRHERINAGFWIASGSWIKGTIYEKMITTVINTTHKIEGADQATVNEVLSNLLAKKQVKLTVLPSGYNFKNWGGAPPSPTGKGRGGEKVFQECLPHIKIIHYSGRRKPWANHIASGERYDSCSIVGIEEMKNSTPGKLWHQYYEECFGEKCTQSIMI